MNRGLLFVISGPSGAGKGTICSAYLKEAKNTWLSVSATTRTPRDGESHGKSYYFMSRDEFQDRLEKGDFLEHAEVYGNYYGTPRSEVDAKLEMGYDVILEIDIQGALKVKENTDEGIFIFILPPSMEELKKRIIGRGSETEDSLDRRFKSAFEEINYISNYNYGVINTTVEEALENVQAIVRAEHCRVDRVIANIKELQEEQEHGKTDYDRAVHN